MGKRHNRPLPHGEQVRILDWLNLPFRSQAIECVSSGEFTRPFLPDLYHTHPIVS